MKKVIDPEQNALGAYSPALRVGKRLYISGQIPLDPETGNILSDDIARATTVVMRKIKTLVDAAGLGMHDIVKTTIYLRDMDDFAVVNAAYEAELDAPYPARATVAVSALPKNAALEIEAIAEADES